MSKKIAEGTSALVLDVKVGTGAFMKSQEQARELAETMVALGEEHGVRTRALLTQMDVPLGRAVGNAVEVEEAVAALHGDGPADLMEVTLALARQMLALAGLRRRSRRRHRGRPGAGRLPGDGPRAGRRPGRPAAPGGAHPGAAGSRVRLADRPGRAGGGHRGLAARGGPGPQGETTSARPRASSAWPSRATGCRPASRCSSSAPTSRSASARPWPPWTGAVAVSEQAPRRAVSPVIEDIPARRRAVAQWGRCRHLPRSGRSRRSCCTITWTAACARRPSSSWPARRVTPTCPVTTPKS